MSAHDAGPRGVVRVTFELEGTLGDIARMERALRERSAASSWLRHRLLAAMAEFVHDLTGDAADLVSRSMTVTTGTVERVK